MSTNNDYLKSVVEKYSLADDSTQITALRDARKKVEECLRAKYGDAARIRYGGSYKKGTMVSTSYDLDILCYFLRDEKVASETLKEIYESVRATLAVDYHVTPKRTALRISDKKGGDLRIDVVPGRFVDDDESDVHLHQNEGDKDYMKTNPDVHIQHVIDSGVREAIKLTKIWRDRLAVTAKTFALDLLVIKLLADHKDDDLEAQFRTVLEAFRDDNDSLSVEDPANSNNDLSGLVDEMRASLLNAATSTLATVDASGWADVFGAIDTKGNRAERIQSASRGDVARVQPWAF